MDCELRKQLDSIADHWNHIEKRAKQAEQVRFAVIMPAINEMRYAGRQIVDAWCRYSKPTLSLEDREFIVGRLVVAEQYLHNANHDISDAVCAYLHKKVKRIVERYNINDICVVMPDFYQFYDRLERVNKIITQTRNNREKRISLYKEIENNYIPELISRCRLLERAEADALAKQRAKNYIGVVKDVMALIGFACSVFGVFWALYSVSDAAPTL